MLGWLILGLAGFVMVLLAGLLSWLLGHSHLGAKRSTGHHVTVVETFYRRPH